MAAVTRYSVAFIFSTLWILTACERGALTRPVGYLRLGPISELKVSETYLPDLKLVVRYDQNGFSVMSTACTHDLTALVQRENNGTKRWYSTLTASEYDETGKVLHGPATAPLPYFDLRLEPAAPGGVPDTLYAHVGVERNSGWRLKP